MGSQNKEWEKEQHKVNFITQEISHKQKMLKENAEVLKEGMMTLRKNFWDDVTVNIDGPDEIIETQASIKQQADLLTEKEISHGRFHEQLRTLERLRDSPYFGRIDFSEDDEEETEPIYIGIASFMDRDEEDFLIYDWRAPISSMYYDYAPGPAQYNTPDGLINGVISLKRQFIIKNSQITGLFDTGLTIGDRLLQEMLGHHASTKMKSIVATIQKEQDQIIRDETSKLLVVQGVAGSGKTSAALQRVAYLLYAHRETLNSDNMILFSPNPLFNSYVATVLPELGEKSMYQTTYEAYVRERLGDQFALESPFQQLETLLEDSNDQTKLDAIQFKSTLAFKEMLDRYIASLAQEGLIFNNIVLREHILISAETIKQYFYSMNNSIPIPNRMELVSEWLLEELEKHKQIECQKAWVEEEVELLAEDDYLNAFKEVQQQFNDGQDAFEYFEREQEVLNQKVVEKYLHPLREQAKQFHFVNVKANYRQFFETRVFPSDSELPNHWDQICEATINNLDHDGMTWDEVTPYLYFQDQLQGRRTYTRIRHVLIDEAQDYSPFQFAYLKSLFPRAQMTLLGDIHQAIHTAAFTSPSILSDKMQDFVGNQKRITLMRSYRSTQPIVEFTRQLIKGGEFIVPFHREGNRPILTETKNEETLHQNILDTVGFLQSQGHQTIAVICKTMKESEKAYERLKSQIPVQLMEQWTDTFQKGVLITPSYLAKGIEFDAVIIYDASNERYSKESERNLFYTACTRAMHELRLFSIGEKSSFFDPVQPETYIERN